MLLASAERLPTPDLAGPATFRSTLFSDTSDLHTSIHVLTYIPSVVRWNRHCSISRLVSRRRAERLGNWGSSHKQRRILLHGVTTRSRAHSAFYPLGTQVLSAELEGDRALTMTYCRGKKCVETCFHYPICLHGVLLDGINAGSTLLFLDVKNHV